MKHIMTLMRWELWQRRWSLLWWIAGIGAFMTLTLSVYPTFRDQAAQLNQSLSQLPLSVRDLFSDTGDFLSPTGYLSSKIFYLMLPLLFSFLTIGLGASLIAREEQSNTIELLLSRPVSRSTLLTGKALAGLCMSLAVGLAVGLLCCLEVSLIGFDGVSTMGVLLATGMALLLSLLFGAIAFTLTAMGALGRGASIGVAALFGLGGYIISSLEGTVRWLRFPAAVLPHHYYKPATPLSGGHAAWPALSFALLIAGLFAVSWFVFRRRDIM